MPVWPSTLPAPKLGTLNESPPDNTIRSTMDKGPPKLRRRTTANVRPISFGLVLTKEQVQILDDFYIDDVFSGSIPFTFEHPRTLAIVQAQFAEKPSWGESEGVCYNASISLEILP